MVAVLSNGLAKGEIALARGVRSFCASCKSFGVTGVLGGSIPSELRLIYPNCLARSRSSDFAGGAGGNGI